MCTVTYLPTGKDSFILTSNRDESRARPTQPPAIVQSGELKLLYPKDALAGGTWICLSNRNRVACIMNGAFERHERKYPYRRSRGLIMLDLFGNGRVEDFLNGYDFDNIEPFTMLIYDNMEMTEFRWDGLKKHVKPVDTKIPQIWSSASLYPKPMRDRREQWFKKWLENKTRFEQEEILNFHRFGGEGDKENDFVMNRYDMVQTVSITSINKTAQGASMKYNDLVENRITETTIEFDRKP